MLKELIVINSARNITETRGNERGVYYEMRVRHDVQKEDSNRHMRMRGTHIDGVAIFVFCV